jgi:hypothetical protein
MVLKRFVEFYRSHFNLLPDFRSRDNPEHRAKRDLHDLHHAEQIKRIWKESSGRYGVRKVWQKLKREGMLLHAVQLLD